MSSSTWHAGAELLRRYEEGSLDQVAQSAVEAHVDRCAQCRQDAVGLVPATTLAPVWNAVVQEVRRPPLPAPLRMLRTVGVRETDLVVLRRSGGLLLALAIATGAVLFYVIAVDDLPAGWRACLFLLLAPLLPVTLVAGAYDGADALRELTDPTPFSKLRVALLRTVLAVGGAVPLLTLMSLIPQVDVSLAAWALPALALSLVLLALLCWYSATTSLSLVAGTWSGIVVLLRLTDNVQRTGTVTAELLSLLVGSVALVALARQLVAGRTGSRT